MASFSPMTRVQTNGLERDDELLPENTYRGRGGDQSNTGPSGSYTQHDPARFLRAPQARHSTRAGRTTPKGYVRADERIREDVCEMMTDHGDLDPSDVEVAVEDGVVFLTGTVGSRWAKFLAENLAAAARGVADVQNDLRIRRVEDGGHPAGPTDDTRGVREYGDAPHEPPRGRF